MQLWLTQFEHWIDLGLTKTRLFRMDECVGKSGIEEGKEWNLH